MNPRRKPLSPVLEKAITTNTNKFIKGRGKKQEASSPHSSSSSSQISERGVKICPP